jgi:MFS family permease
LIENRVRYLIYATAFLRAVTTSASGILIGVFLARQGIAGPAFGAIVGAGLFAAALAALIATFRADRLGRRRFLIAVAALSGLGTLAFAFGSNPFALALAAFVGMLNGMGRDRGAALILEQALLPATTAPENRTRVIAGYTMLQDLGHAAGALLAGLPSLIEKSAAHSGASSQRTLLAACGAISLLSVFLYTRLGPQIEAAPGTERSRLSPRSRAILVRISALFAVDGIGGGFLTSALLSFFFFERFGASEGKISLLFFCARLLNAVSHLGAAWLAARIGLVRTMVFTHIPSSLLLATVPFAPSFWVAAILFLLREGLVEMDVPTRQSYVLAVVRPEERTFASGVTNLVRLAAWAVAPFVAGALMTVGPGGSLYLPLLVGAGLKIAYDLLLWRAFRGVPPPEEI